MSANLDHLHLWLGNYEDDAALDALFREQYEDRSKPLNGFATSQGQRRYDHDFIEYRLGRGESLEELIRLNSYGQYYGDAALTAANNMQIEKANLFILADAHEFRSPRDVQMDGISLRYLGRFAYKK